MSGHDIWMAPAAGAAVGQVAVLATSVCLHRGLAHQALAIHPVAALVFRAVLWITTGHDRALVHVVAGDRRRAARPPR